MFGGCVAILLAVGVVLSAVGAAIAFATSKAEDPKLQLLGSLLRLAADEPTVLQRSLGAVDKLSTSRPDGGHTGPAGLDIRALDL